MCEPFDNGRCTACMCTCETDMYKHTDANVRTRTYAHMCACVWRGGGLGSSTISKNLVSPTPRRKWYLTTGRRAH